MKRTLLILGGVTIILVLIGIWMFILFTGTTSEDVSFSDFEFGNTTDPNVFIPEENNDPTVDTVTDEEAEIRLRQLTTRPVIGFTEVTASSTDIFVHYIEAGTGHIYSLNLESGEEERISATTIPQARMGVITPDGKHTLIQSGDAANKSFVVGSISESSDRLSNTTLNEQIHSFTATVSNEFLYSVITGNNLLVKAYEPVTATTRDLFTIPFRDATISWHHTTDGPHIVYPKTTSRLEGYVYSYTNGSVTRINATGFGLAAVGSTDAIIHSSIVGETYTTYSMGADSLERAKTPITLIPEKCQFTSRSSTIAVCGSSFQELPYLMPDPWYRGTLFLNDSLWEYNTERQSARLLVSPETVTGRQVDLINPQFGINDINLYFQNKADQTLWTYKYRNTFN